MGEKHRATQNAEKVSRDSWQNRIITAAEVAELYNSYPEHWLLLEVLETAPSGRASKFKLLAHDKSKDALYDYLMEDESWDWNKKYIMVYADPNYQCEI